MTKLRLVLIAGSVLACLMEAQAGTLRTSGIPARRSEDAGSENVPGFHGRIGRAKRQTRRAELSQDKVGNCDIPGMPRAAGRERRRNDAAQPCLMVNDLKLGETLGQIALWSGSDTEGHFSNLTVR